MVSVSKYFLAGLLLAFILPTAFGQSCYSSGEQVLSLIHPKDDTDYYFVFADDWVFKSKEGNEVFYDKGTSDLTFLTGAVTSTQSELSTKPRIIFSKYNNTTNYQVITSWTPLTVGTRTAFFIEFKDKQQAASTLGKTMIIFGDEVEGQKKYYAVTLLAKEPNYPAEKTLFDEASNSFSLLLPGECTNEPDPPADDQPADDPPVEDPADDSPPADDQPADEPADDPSDSSDSSDNQPSGNNDSKIFGLDPLLFAGGIILLLLIVFFVIVVIVVIAVLAYLAFFKKR